MPPSTRPATSSSAGLDHLAEDPGPATRIPPRAGTYRPPIRTPYVPASTGYLAAGRGLGRYRKRQPALRATLQKKRTKSAKRRLKARARKEARHAANTNHIISKTIVTEAERTGRGLSLEELKGIRNRVRLRKPGGTSHALKAVGEGLTLLLGIRPARELHRLQGQAGRGAPGLR